jgi:hypothetical protein
LDERINQYQRTGWTFIPVAVHPYINGALFNFRGKTMKWAAAPILFAGSQPDKIYRPCALLKSDDEASPVLPPAVSSGPRIRFNSSQEFA